MIYNYCRYRRLRRQGGLLFAACSLFLAASLFGQLKTNEQTLAELKKLSLEELMNVEVTTVTRSPGLLSESASAAQVISGEDIRRSGARTLPEALRLASEC